VYYRVLIAGQPVTPVYTNALVEQFLAATGSREDAAATWRSSGGPPSIGTTGQ
jgi:hypothetical protein